MPIEIVADQISSHPNRPFLMVDAAQSFGQIPIGLAAHKSDIYAFTGHKWACGPEGLGGVALSERVLEEARPTLIGWRSLQNEHKASHKKPPVFHLDSRRFEIATSCIPLLAGLRSSLFLLKQEGTELERLKKIQGKSLMLWQSLKDLKGITMLLQTPPPAGLVSFKTESHEPTGKLVKYMGNENIWIRDLEDPECLRACVHVTSNKEEITNLIRITKRYLRDF